MKQYLDVMKEIIETGDFKDDRTGTGTISKFGMRMEFDISEKFPLLTTKKVFLRGIIHELLWFISGDTNIKYLVDNDVHIWDDWAFDKYKKSEEYLGETIKEFAAKIKESQEFADKWGNLSKIYSYQWRNFNGQGIDQVANLVHDIKTNPNSRRLILCAWNPADTSEMALPPCHSFIQFYVNNDKLSCQLTQRSGDHPIGIPFNIASYSLFTMMLAQVCGLKPGKFIHTIGDAHVYINQLDGCKKQLERTPRELPTMKINPDVKSIFDFKFEDFELCDYNPYPAIKMPVAV